MDDWDKNLVGTSLVWQVNEKVKGILERLEVLEDFVNENIKEIEKLKLKQGQKNSPKNLEMESDDK